LDRREINERGGIKITNKKIIGAWMPIGLVISIALLTACSVSPATETPAPTPVVIVNPVTPTPVPQATSTLAPTRTIQPTPTAFVTPPVPGQAGIVPILMYHHLADLPKQASELDLTWTVAPKNFEQQMNLLAERGYHTISMAQLVAYLKKSQPLPTKPIVISFDDGWAQQYAAAFPILKKNSMIGTFFVYTNALDKSQFMTWKQVEEMSAAGMDIQSHTLTHPHLRQLAPEAAAKEIGDSKMALEKRLGKPVTAFDYPFGEYNTAVIDLVKKAGYESAVTIADGTKQRGDELYTLHRSRVTYTDTLQVFGSRMP
jgi:peptidoglycan/xylan/chitin deacetylase (PgdA/CDA1 family)